MFQNVYLVILASSIQITLKMGWLDIGILIFLDWEVQEEYTCNTTELERGNEMFFSRLELFDSLNGKRRKSDSFFLITLIVVII